MAAQAVGSSNEGFLLWPTILIETVEGHKREGFTFIFGTNYVVYFYGGQNLHLRFSSASLSYVTRNFTLKFS